MADDKHTPPSDSRRKIEIAPTDISKLDLALNGGIPVGSLILITGPTGAGKTVMSAQWLFAGWEKHEDPGIYIGFAESTQKVLQNLSLFSFYDEEAIAPSRVHFTDMDSMIEGRPIARGEKVKRKEMEKFIKKLVDLTRDMGAKRVVIDSITVLLQRMSESERRWFLSQLRNAMVGMDVTLFLTSEAHEDPLSASGLEEFMVNGVLILSNFAGENERTRELRVKKMQGVGYRSGIIKFEITSDGIQVYPKVKVERGVAKTNYENRKHTGDEDLNEMTGGGYPQGHTILLSGDTGSGKTTLGLQFLVQGIKEGESAVMLALEESRSQIVKTALAHGWDFAKWERAGKLKIVNPSLIDIYPDKILYDTIEAVEDINASRLMVDSVSSLEGATLNKENVREMLIQLRYHMKGMGVTSVMTYLSSNIFGGNKNQLFGEVRSSKLRLSSISDGIILLRYIQYGDSVEKLINILKMRGSVHQKKVRHYDLTKGGIKIGGKPSFK